MKEKTLGKLWCRSGVIDRLQRGGERPEVQDLDEQRAARPERDGREHRDDVGEVQREVEAPVPTAVGGVDGDLDRERAADQQRERSRRQQARSQDRDRDGERREDEDHDVFA